MKDLRLPFKLLITRATICWPYLAHKTSSLFAKGRSVACLDTPVRLEQQWQGVRNRNTRCTKAKKHKGTLMSIALRMQLDELPTVCWHLLCNLKQWKFSNSAHLAMKVYCYCAAHLQARCSRNSCIPATKNGSLITNNSWLIAGTSNTETGHVLNATQR